MFEFDRVRGWHPTPNHCMEESGLCSSHGKCSSLDWMLLRHHERLCFECMRLFVVDSKEFWSCVQPVFVFDRGLSNYKTPILVQWRLQYFVVVVL